MRQIADKADGVREHGGAAATEFDLAGAGDEGGKEAIIGVGTAGGEGVEEGGFAGVGVADEADGEVFAFSFEDLAAFAGLDLAEAFAEIVAAILHEAAVDFELLFAWAAGADAARATCAAGADDAFEVGPHAADAWVGVFELGEFDLELCFGGGGAAGEDIEDEFGAVDDFAFGDFFDGGDLLGGEVVIEDDGGGGELFAEVGEFSDFS